MGAAKVGASASMGASGSERGAELGCRRQNVRNDVLPARPADPGLLNAAMPDAGTCLAAPTACAVLRCCRRFPQQQNARPEGTGSCQSRPSNDWREVVQPSMMCQFQADVHATRLQHEGDMNVMQRLYVALQIINCLMGCDELTLLQVMQKTFVGWPGSCMQRSPVLGLGGGGGGGDAQRYES